MVDTNENFTQYQYGETEFLNISNRWSRKNIRRLVSGEEGVLLHFLKEKCTFVIFDEDGNKLTHETINEENIENIDILLHNWISTTLVEHIDFLLSLVQKREEE